MTPSGRKATSTVYQVLTASGTLDSEHSSLLDARAKAATIHGGRIRAATKST